MWIFYLEAGFESVPETWHIWIYLAITLFNPDNYLSFLTLSKIIYKNPEVSFFVQLTKKTQYSSQNLCSKLVKHTHTHTHVTNELFAQLMLWICILTYDCISHSTARGSGACKTWCVSEHCACICILITFQQVLYFVAERERERQRCI